MIAASADAMVVRQAVLVLAALPALGVGAMLHASASMAGIRARTPLAMAGEESPLVRAAQAGGGDSLFPTDDGSSAILIKDRNIDEYTDPTRVKKRMTAKPYETGPASVKPVNRAAKRAAKKKAAKKKKK